MIRFPWRRRLQAEPTEPQAEGVGAVHGERDRFIASGTRSLQSRMTTLLAAGLMTSVGAGMLAWYYAEALSRPAVARTLPQESLPQPAGEGMSLPTFGGTAPARMPSPAALASRVQPMPSIATVPAFGKGRPSAVVPVPLNPLLDPPLDRTPGGLAGGYGSSSQVPLRQQVLDRRLSGEVFASGTSGMSSNFAAAGLSEGPAPGPAISNQQAQVPASGSHRDVLQTLLATPALNVTRAQLVPTRRLLLPKGAFIDCTLETAIDSTLPGMTTCTTATDTFGADGMVVLLERGTKLTGETRGEVGQGQARVFVVWTEARTPSGVVVRLDSPGTDALGRSGLDGTVNRHFWQRFGAAALVSTIDGVVQSEVQSSSRSGTVVLDPTASEDVLNDILRSTVNIPPTIRVRNGARIQVLVARDLDFRPVYELESR
jgi:type IV secretion system protein VirB10